MHYYSGYIYVVGSTSSTGWTVNITDMAFTRLDTTSGTSDYLYTLGGNEDDYANCVKASTDGYVYAIGYSYSVVELTNYNSVDIIFIKYL